MRRRDGSVVLSVDSLDQSARAHTQATVTVHMTESHHNNHLVMAGEGEEGMQRYKEDNTGAAFLGEAFRDKVKI